MNIADATAKYIRHSRSLGKHFTAENAILTAFCRSIGNPPLCDIQPEMIKCFVNREGTSDETVRRKHRALAGFFRFAVTRHLLKSSPMPCDMRKHRWSTYTPYIYTDVELRRLVNSIPAAAGKRTDIDPDTLRTLLLLLYGAALRRGEALRLQLGDLDLTQSLIVVRATKFFKTRIVPMGTSLSGVMQTFIKNRRKHWPMEIDSPVFCKRDGRPLSHTIVASAFWRLRLISGIRRDGGARNQPRLHDLRHSAAVHRVTAWYRQGADLNDLLPKLATYLGHKDLSGTQRYLTMTQELLAEASFKFETFVRGNCHD